MTRSNSNVNRGAITLSPQHNEQWAQRLLDRSAMVDEFHICEDIQMADGSRFVLFCDGNTCDGCDEWPEAPEPP